MNDDRFENGHPAWGVLNDLADHRDDALGGAAGGATDDAERVMVRGGMAGVVAHVAVCAQCRATVAAIRDLSRGAAALDRGAAPPPVLWDEISRSIAAGGHSPARTPDATPARGAANGAVLALPRRTYTLAPRTLAAAALVLMALTSGVTALLLRSRATAPAPVAASAPRAAPAPVAADGTGALPASFTAAESAYLSNLAELHAAFLAQRSALAPATVAVVERSLATIDSAIAEARAALVADPANQSLAELLSATYQHKVELLRRATEYSAS
ncbi:MAG: hypothetical protein IT359_14695 [Gemmatimonadaceae bacterium]|nr:hypothetical protein [Gemmatimonadaceae bacterium]